ncbi:AAA family ATPase [Spirosoma sp. KCTC 42546]|uniref:AAA family ATPase n=1 Tax=Spirosoma sp. KCTC 42546 TaxID=2520506 RepID=UPI0011597BB3|nr:AAA family ATPase [Spirosoma sp. KCTC 42546]QDK77646.1 AAA family ATPase [Spirosoma sp. KCTC 42546]
MKITGVDIGEYRQFKNIKFDFTYPADYHDKAKVGKPLEKVCFIGQSGTGKTTLLNVIWDFFRLIEDSHLAINNREVIHNNWADFDILYNPISIQIESQGTSVSYQTEDLSKYDNHRQVRLGILMKWLEKNGLVDTINTTNKACLFIKESIAREADAFLFDQKDQPQTFSDFVKTDTQIEKEKVAHDERINAAGSKKVVSLGDMQSISTWQYLLKAINQYDEDTVQQITKIIQSTPKSKVTEELQKWVISDPRIELAEKCLNPILDKFHLEVNVGEKGKAPIAIHTKKDVKIPSSNLSTGTRQFLATAIPVYKFDTNGTVILFDEPERSLFPDIQRILVKYYTDLAPEAQFFFATHSPIIASAFEPCERFILYFNENGEVNFHRGIAPIGDDPNDILSEDFRMEELMLQPGLDAYERYRNLFVEIKNEKDPERQKELIVEQAKLGDQYKF